MLNWWSVGNGSIRAKFEAFDWDVIDIKEGNNIEAIIAGDDANLSNRKRKASLCFTTYRNG
jgi:transketolase